MVCALRYLVFVFAILFVSKLYAFTINIDPNGYVGLYRVNGGSYVSGNQSFELSEGTFTFENHPGSFSFEVDNSGNVSSLQPTSALGNGNTLTLNTIAVVVDPQLYTGGYTVFNHPVYSSSHTFTLIVDSIHRLVNRINGTITNFQVNGTGTAYNISNPDNIITSTGEIFLKNASLTINPSNFDGQYRVNNTNYTGVQNVVLLSGTVDRILTVTNGTIANIIVDDNGQVTNVGQNNLVIGNGEITFKTVPVAFYPGLYNYGYLVGYDFTYGYYFGEQYLNLIPEADTRITAKDGITIANFKIDDVGNVIWSDGTSINHDTRAVFFRNQNVRLTVPAGFTGFWSLFEIGNGQNPSQDLLLIPNLIYRLVLNGTTIHPFMIEDCLSDVQIPTPSGNFVASCLENDLVKNVNKNTEKFIPVTEQFKIQHINNKFSSNINEYSLLINGSSIALTSFDLDNYILAVNGVLLNGINQIQINGKDEFSNIFTRNYTFWAGGSEVTVTTTGASDTVTLTVEQFISGVKYTKSIVQTAVGSQTIFENVPQIENGVVYVSTNRSKKRTRLKVFNGLKIHL